MDSDDEPVDGFWEVVATASGMTQAELIAGRLASEGIPTQRRYEAAWERSGSSSPSPTGNGPRRSSPVPTTTPNLPGKRICKLP
jgi:hypothetical protein